MDRMGDPQRRAMPTPVRDLLLAVVDDLHESVGVVGAGGELLFANRAARATPELFAAPAALSLADEVRRDGRTRRGVVIEHDGERWRGRVSPIGDGAVILVHREIRRPSAVDRVGARLGLTPPEARLAVHIAEGLTNNEIAERLAVPTTTIHGRVSLLLRRLGLHRRSQVAAQTARCLAAPEDAEDGR
jgi:DNA-binding CsgD family transcriptional regulator